MTEPVEPCGQPAGESFLDRLDATATDRMSRKLVRQLRDEDRAAAGDTPRPRRPLTLDEMKRKAAAAAIRAAGWNSTREASEDFARLVEMPDGDFDEDTLDAAVDELVERFPPMFNTGHQAGTTRPPGARGQGGRR